MEKGKREKIYEKGSVLCWMEPWADLTPGLPSSAVCFVCLSLFQTCASSHVPFWPMDGMHVDGWRLRKVVQKVIQGPQRHACNQKSKRQNEGCPCI